MKCIRRAIIKNYSPEVFTLFRVLFSKEDAYKHLPRVVGPSSCKAMKHHRQELGRHGGGGTERGWGNKGERHGTSVFFPRRPGEYLLIRYWFHDLAGFSCSSLLLSDQEWERGMMEERV